MAAGQSKSHYYPIDGTLVLLIANELIVAWILHDLLNPAPICWSEMLQYANETCTEFDEQIMQQFGLTTQRLRRMYRTLETCVQMRLDTLLSKKLDIHSLNALRFPFRSQMITGLFEGVLAFLANSWHIWLIWRARTPSTITPNNVALPALNVAALSSLFWIVISIFYEWSEIWRGKSLLSHPPAPPFAEIRILVLILSGIIISWLLLYSLYHAFNENNNGQAKFMLLESTKSS